MLHALQSVAGATRNALLAAEGLVQPRFETMGELVTVRRAVIQDLPQHFPALAAEMTPLVTRQLEAFAQLHQAPAMALAVTALDDIHAELAFNAPEPKIIHCGDHDFQLAMMPLPDFGRETQIKLLQQRLAYLASLMKMLETTDLAGSLNALGAQQKQSMPAIKQMATVQRQIGQILKSAPQLPIIGQATLMTKGFEVLQSQMVQLQSLPALPPVAQAIIQTVVAEIRDLPRLLPVAAAVLPITPAPAQQPAPIPTAFVPAAPQAEIITLQPREAVVISQIPAPPVAAPLMGRSTAPETMAATQALFTPAEPIKVSALPAQPTLPVLTENLAAQPVVQLAAPLASSAVPATMAATREFFAVSEPIKIPVQTVQGSVAPPATPYQAAPPAMTAVVPAQIIANVGEVTPVAITTAQPTLPVTQSPPTTVLQTLADEKQPPKLADKYADGDNIKREAREPDADRREPDRRQEQQLWLERERQREEERRRQLEEQRRRYAEQDKKSTSTHDIGTKERPPIIGKYRTAANVSCERCSGGGCERCGAGARLAARLQATPK